MGDNMKITKTAFIGSALLSFSLLNLTTANAEYYIAADASYMKSRAQFYDGSTRFTLNTGRLRFGQRLESFGWEIHAIAPASDTGTFSNGDVDELEIRGGLGILWTAASEDRRFYGGIGITQVFTDYKVIAGSLAGSSSESDSTFVTITLGAQYPISKQARISVDYSYYLGDFDCTFCTVPVGLSASDVDDPEIHLSTLSIGFNYSF
jgi:hypothetical protein